MATIPREDIINIAFADEIMHTAELGTHAAAFDLIKEAGLFGNIGKAIKHALGKKYHTARRAISTLGSKYRPTVLGRANSTSAIGAHDGILANLEEGRNKYKAALLVDGAMKQKKIRDTIVGDIKKNTLDSLKDLPFFGQAIRDRKLKAKKDYLRREKRKMDAQLKADRLRLEQEAANRAATNTFAHIGRPLVGTAASGGAATVAGMGMVGIPAYVAGQYILGSNKRPTERVKLGSFVFKKHLNTSEEEI
ncbi:hypothetical protein H8D85_01565 [bacterium]|nr:hypothetical protein [bacterium]